MIFVQKNYNLRFKKDFMAQRQGSHKLFSVICGPKISIFIFIYQWEWGKESLILLLEKYIFFIKSPKRCPGGIKITNNIWPGFRHAENVKN